GLVDDQELVGRGEGCQLRLDDVAFFDLPGNDRDRTIRVSAPYFDDGISRRFATNKPVEYVGVEEPRFGSPRKGGEREEGRPFQTRGAEIVGKSRGQVSVVVNDSNAPFGLRGR